MEKKSWKDWEALISKNEREGALPFLPPFLRNHQFNEFVKRGWKGVGSWKGTSGIVWSNITDVGQQAEWNRELDEARLRPNCQVAVVCNSTLCSSHWRVHDSHSVDRHPTFRFLEENFSRENLIPKLKFHRIHWKCIETETGYTIKGVSGTWHPAVLRGGSVFSRLCPIPFEHQIVQFW